MIMCEIDSAALSAAGINTLICLLMVFAVLIFISFLISLFKYIPKIEAALAKKKENKSELATSAVSNAVSQIEAKEEEELVDDLELVAVITAAIAASTGTSTDGFVVRSIRRSNTSKWARA